MSALTVIGLKLAKAVGKAAWKERYEIWKRCPGIGLNASRERDRLRQLRQVELEGGGAVEPEVANRRGKSTDKRDGSALVAIPLALAVLLLSGCALLGIGVDKGTEIEAPHSKDVLYGALHSAEAQLGMQHRGGKIRVRYEEGSVMSSYGWKGKRVDGGILGGTTSSIGNTKLYLTDGKVHPHNAEHEMGHQVLFSNGFPANQHHEIMKAKGFRW